VTVDFKQKKLRLDAAKDATLMGATRYYVAGIGLQENITPPILVSEVLPGSSAADQGIAAGDELQVIAGQAIASIDPYDRPWMLVSPAPATIAVTVAHAGVPQSFMLDTRDLLTPPP
jgi:S1-C subfamily serine protease